MCLGAIALLAVFSPASLASDLDQARSLLHSPQRLQCANEIEAGLRKHPNSAEWLQLKALFMPPSDGYIYAQKAFSIEPHSAQMAATCALIAQERGNCDNALYMAGAALHLEPQCGLAFAVIAVCKSHESGKNADSDALKACNRAVQLSPNDYYVNRLTAGCYELAGDMPRAESCIHRMIAAYPNSIDPLMMLAKLKRRNGQYDEALAYFDKAAKVDPANASAVAARARMLQDLGKHDAAEAGLKKWARIFPTAFPAHFFLGREYELGGHKQQAIDCYSKAIATANQPTSPDKFLKEKSMLGKREYMWCWVYRMKLLEQLGKTDQALAQAGAMLAADRNCDTALDVRQRIFMKQGRYADAIKDLSSLISLDNDIADWYTARAAAYTKLNKPKEAAADLARARHLDQYGF